MLRAKQEAERLAAQARENEARAHQLAQHHQGILSEVEKHTHSLTQARTDAEKHMQRACLPGSRVFSICACAAVWLSGGSAIFWYKTKLVTAYLLDYVHIIMCTIFLCICMAVLCGDLRLVTGAKGLVKGLAWWTALMCCSAPLA